MRSTVWLSLPGRASQPLLGVGGLGIALAAMCTIIAATRGLSIPPEGDLTKAITFDLAVGIYLITLGCIVPLAHFSAAGERRWVGASVGLALYAYGMETIQQLRGIDPRFSRVGGLVDGLVGTGFVLVALGLIVMFSILAVTLVRRGTRGADGLVVLGLRYAIGATMLAFAAGVWMSAIGGRYTGESGNILPLHAFGFHALQAIPLVAWLFSRSNTPEHEARRWVHAAGAAWLAACLGIAWQTALGRAVTEPSPPILAALVVLVCWLVCAVRAAQAWRASRLSTAVPSPAT
jgi:hypothetical protein